MVFLTFWPSKYYKKIAEKILTKTLQPSPTWSDDVPYDNYIMMSWVLLKWITEVDWLQVFWWFELIFVIVVGIRRKRSLNSKSFLDSRSHVVILNFHVFLQARTKSMFYCCCPSPKIYSPGMKWIFVNVRIRVSRTTGPAWLRQLDSECLRDSRDVGPGGAQAQAHKAGPRSWLFFLLDVGVSTKRFEECSKILN